MPAFGSNAITVSFAMVVLDKERIVSGAGTEEDPYVYEKIGFRLSDRIVSALDRFIGSLSRFRIANTGVMDRWLFLYPFVGEVDWVHAMNLADVADGFRKFEISWSGNVTHGSNGVTIGSGGSGSTNCDMADKVNNADALQRRSHGVYNRTGGAVGTKDFTASFLEPKNGYTYSQGMFLRSTDGNAYADLCYYAKTGVTTIPNRIMVAVTGGTGLYSDSQRGTTASPYHYLYRNGVMIESESSAEIGMGFADGLGLAILRLQGLRNYAFFFSTKHKKALEYPALPGTNANFYYSVQQFQVALGRAV